jgi:hypothetical protein
VDPNDRVRKLVALATDKSASLEEARTAAVAACRLIAKHKLLDGPAEHVGAEARRRPGARRPRHEENGHHEARGNASVNYRAARAGTCAFCATAFGPEDEVMTYARGSVDHWHCAKRRASGAEPGT